jgi:hypothetical protein
MDNRESDFQGEASLQLFVLQISLRFSLSVVFVPAPKTPPPKMSDDLDAILNGSQFDDIDEDFSVDAIDALLSSHPELVAASAAEDAAAASAASRATAAASAIANTVMGAGGGVPSAGVGLTDEDLLAELLAEDGDDDDMNAHIASLLPPAAVLHGSVAVSGGERSAGTLSAAVAPSTPAPHTLAPSPAAELPSASTAAAPSLPPPRAAPALPSGPPPVPHAAAALLSPSARHAATIIAEAAAEEDVLSLAGGDDVLAALLAAHVRLH